MNVTELLNLPIAQNYAEEREKEKYPLHPLVLFVRGSFLSFSARETLRASGELSGVRTPGSRFTVHSTNSTTNDKTAPKNFIFIWFYVEEPSTSI